MIDPLTLDQMRVLVAVADSGSFSAAARKLGRVQSAISQAIQTMEATLGVSLFDRSAKTPALTDAGAAIVGDCRALVVQAKAVRARAQSIAEGVEPELTLAVDGVFPMALLRDGLAAWRDAYPGLPASVFTDELGGAIETLRAGEARMAICPLPGGPAPDLSVEFLCTVRLAPVVATNHLLAQTPEPVRIEDLEPHVQLVLTGRTPYAKSLRGGIVSRQIWRFADLHTRLDFLLAGFGWCNMPLHFVEPHLASGRLKRLRVVGDPKINFPVYVVVERGRRLGRAGRWLVEDLRTRIRRCPESLFDEPQSSPTSSLTDD
jgi:DNA-binding transcriptional LysR family regulator